jgi:Ca2+-binding RTX toxin-like protein
MNIGTAAYTLASADFTSDADTLVGTSGVDTIDGGKGDDRIDGRPGADLLLGGAGNDTIVWNPGDGSDTVDGGKGEDTLAFNTAVINEVITLSGDDAGHVLLSRNVGSVNMDLDGVERIVFGGAGGGEDLFVVGDLTHSDVRQVDIDLGLVGDKLVDTVVAGGTEAADHIAFTNAGGAVTIDGLGTELIVRNAEATDRFAVSTGSGDDQIDVSQLNGGPSIVFDGGEGHDRVVANGTDAADTIVLFGLSKPAEPDGDPVDLSINDVASHLGLRNVETMAVGAGDGDDVVDARIYVAPAALEVDGGRGDDTLTGGFNADTLAGGSGADRIDGGGGADLMRGEAGDDTLIWNPGGGSDTVDGGQGEDRLIFNTTNIGETIGLSAASDGHAFLSRDVAAIAMDVSGIERVSFSGAGGGADRFNIGDLKGTGIGEVDIELRELDGSGDGASDIVSLIGLSARHDHLDVQITGFEVHGGALQGDVIQLIGFAEHTFIEAVSHQHIMQSGDDVLIADGTGLVVTLQGVSLTSLAASDFLFG